MSEHKEDDATTCEDDRRLQVMRDAAPVRAVVTMGVPLIAGMLVMVLYNWVDTYFIGLTHDDYQLAAVNLSYPVSMVMVALANMVGTGASSLMARSLGAHDTRLAERTLTCALVLTVCESLLITLLGLALAGPIVGLLGARELTRGHTLAYVRVILAGALPTMGSYTMGQLLRAEGSVAYSVVGMLAGTLTNIVLDPALILGMGLGCAGAATATVAGNIVATLVPTFLYARRKTLLAPRRAYLVPRATVCREIFVVGVPASLETLLTSSAYVVANQLTVGHGELTVAAMGVSSKIMSLGSYIYQGFAAGTQPIMGYNYGAKRYGRMLAVLRAGISVTTGVELCVLALFTLLAPTLIGLFTDTAEVLAIGVMVLRANVWILPFVGATSMVRMSFQAMGMPLRALAITLVRQLILYVPAMLAADALFGLSGLIWAQPAVEAVMCVVSVGLLTHVLRRAQGASGGQAS